MCTRYMLNLSVSIIEQDIAGGETAVYYITHASRLIHKRGKVGCNRFRQSDMDFMFVCMSVLNRAWLTKITQIQIHKQGCRTQMWTFLNLDMFPFFCTVQLCLHLYWSWPLVLLNMVFVLTKKACFVKKKIIVMIRICFSFNIHTIGQEALTSSRNS